jgi:hypothetical protein
MADPTVYELLAKQIEGGFERIDDRMAALLEQQRITNGRVNEAHVRLAVHDAQLEAGAKRIEILSSRTHDTENKLQTFMGSGVSKSVRSAITRDVTLIASTVAAMIAVLKLLKVLP